MANYINFTSTPRKFLDDAVNHYGKVTAATEAALTDRERQRLHQLLMNMVELLRAPNIDSTVTCTGSITSGSIITFNLTA